VALLAVAAVGFNAATQYLQLTFRKQPVPLAQPLKDLPAEMGHWLQVSKDRPLPHDIEEALGTKEYVMRWYVDRRKVSDAEIAALKKVIDDPKSSSEQCDAALGALYRAYPQAFVQFAVTYYTGLVDTVAHIPERCVVADGYEPQDPQTLVWETEKSPVEVRFINFEDQTGFERTPRAVAYTFHVNGHYESSPTGVRRSLQNLFQKYGYYAKLEMMAQGMHPEQARTIMNEFLALAAPRVEQVLPDWEALTQSN
jgi:hypothetical protein